MKTILKSYFLYLLKPTLMITTFYLDLDYLMISKFPNDIFKSIYLFTFLIKPIFFLALMIGFIMNSKIIKFSELLITFFILSNIFLGFPIKEFCDIFNFNQINKFFEGKQYILKEYILNHFIVNLIIENIPILLFALINNMTVGKFHLQFNGPIIINSMVILVNCIYLNCIYLNCSKQN